ncbi:MAG: histidine phosphatase family protein [Oscillatoriales cyanobacterium SM2_3_0]|nr:histidine phosphatase family protein [Oscillatoriales cyanobacterium SM2_3_0]
MTLSSLAMPSLITSQKFKSHATSEVVIVRHGRSNYNEQGIHQGASDGSVLTLQGREAAYKTGLALSNFKFDVIYTSPLQRVLQTTEEILRAFQELGKPSHPIFVDNRLTEINMACWEGLTYQKVQEDLAEDYTSWKQTPHLFAFKSATGKPYFPLQELYQQSQKFWQEILVKHCGQRILVIAHGGTNRTLISSAVGLGPEYYHQFQQSNTCINWLEFPVPGSLTGKLKWLNSTHHLEEPLPKLKAGKHGWRWVLISNQIQQLQALQNCLSQEPIKIVLSDDSDASETIAKNWCKGCLSTVHLSVKQTDFLDIWGQNIIAPQNRKTYLIQV